MDEHITEETEGYEETDAAETSDAGSAKCGSQCACEKPKRSLKDKMTGIFKKK